jgi:hypothetical protein
MMDPSLVDPLTNASFSQIHQSTRYALDDNTSEPFMSWLKETEFGKSLDTKGFTWENKNCTCKVWPYLQECTAIVSGDPTVICKGYKKK